MAGLWHPWWKSVHRRRWTERLFVISKCVRRQTEPGAPDSHHSTQILGCHGVQLLPHWPSKALTSHFKEITSFLFCSFCWVSTRWLSGHNTYWQLILIESRGKTTRQNPHPKEFTAAAFRRPRALFSQTSLGKNVAGEAWLLAGRTNEHLASPRRHLSFLWYLCRLQYTYRKKMASRIKMMV